MADNGDGASSGPNRADFDFNHTDPAQTTFREAFRRAERGDRLDVEAGLALLTTGRSDGSIDPDRMEAVLRLADRRRREVCGEDVTFVANLNNNLTTACNTGCLFCNFKEPAPRYESRVEAQPTGFTRTPEESHRIVSENVRRGISEVCSVSGLHPALVLDESHRERLEKDPVNYHPPEHYDRDPGSYVRQMRAMTVSDVHLHAVTPEEAHHARRGTEWSYERVYERLARAGLDSVPGTAAEILVDEVREVICPAKISTREWIRAMRAAARVGLPMTATIMYGHVEHPRHRVMHLDTVRSLQDETGNITEFVPLKFVHPDTPLQERGMVDGTSSRAEDRLLMAVSRLYLDNVENLQSSWVKYGDELGVQMLQAGANDFMGTLLSEQITRRAGGEHGQFRSFKDYVSLLESIDRRPVERSTDYTRRRPVEAPADPATDPGPRLGPRADGSPLLSDSRAADEAD